MNTAFRWLFCAAAWCVCGSAVVSAEQLAGLLAGPPQVDAQLGVRPPFAYDFQAPFGIAYDGLAAGGKSFFVVELDGGRLLELPTDGSRVVRHLGGNGEEGFSGDGGPPADAVFRGMHNVAIDGHVLFIADTWNHCVRRVDLRTQRVTTLAGTGRAGFAGDGGPAREAQFHDVMCVSLNPAGNRLYVADLKNHRIRMIDLVNDRVSTIAGNGEVGVPRDHQLATKEPLVDPRAVVADDAGHVYILERGGHAVRMVSPDGRIRTLAGTGEAGYRDGPGPQAQLSAPKHLCLAQPPGGASMLLIADDRNAAVRRLDLRTQKVSTVLGRGYGDDRVSLNRPHGVMYRSGRLFVVDSGHQRILTWPLANAPDNVQQRGSFAASRETFERTGRGHVAFMGGSITQMEGYRPLVCEALRARYPQTDFTFTNAGISSTCSTSGAFRLATDVLHQGPVDLFFLEFAVNDDQDAAHSTRECVLGMEGILRQCRAHNPAMDIVITFFVNPAMLRQLQAGKTPRTIAAHERVAAHYGVTTIHLAQEVADRIAAGTLTWKEYGGTHPARPGNQLAADLIDGMLHADPRPMLFSSSVRRAAKKSLPRPLDLHSYARGRFVPSSDIQLQAGFARLVPDWKTLPGNCREAFRQRELLCADTEGAELRVDFSGDALGAYLLAGPDAGAIEISVDGEPVRKVELYHRFSRSLHYPRTVMLARDLARGDHQAVVRCVRSGDDQRQGHAVRVLEFVAN